MAVEVEVPRRLFSVEEYHRMAEAGILGEDERVELIEGEIVQMAPIGPRHCWQRHQRQLGCSSRGLGIGLSSRHRTPLSSGRARSLSRIWSCSGRGRSPTARSCLLPRMSCL